MGWRMGGCMKWMVALTGLALMVTGHAATVEVGGVPFESALQLGGSTLQLNGAGVRYKAVFKVYAAGLYLARKASNLDQVVNATGPKRMQVTMLRDIDADTLGKLFSRGLEDNMDRASFTQLVPGILRMSQIFSRYRRLKEGDTFTLDWIPGRGLIVSVNGKAEGAPFEEPAFFRALMAIWLGHSPADWTLKDALLAVPGEAGAAQSR